MKHKKLLVVTSIIGALGLLANVINIEFKLEKEQYNKKRVVLMITLFVLYLNITV